MMRPLRSITLLSSTLALSSALAAPSSPGMSKLTLKYFDARGRAETARILLVLGDEDWSDSRYDMVPGKMESPTFQAAKESGELKANLGKAPVLITPEGVAIGQSHAIERFLAKRFSMMGSNPTEEALVDCVAEHCRDVRDAQMRKGFSFFAKGKTDEEKEALRKEWFEADMPEMLGKIDEAVRETGTEGYAVGSARSYADVAIWSMLRDCYPPYAEETAGAAEKCEVLRAIADAVGADPKVLKWVEERPESPF